MESNAEDYYDMPIELLPSANFAGRPMSDISMLDGLWAVISSSSADDDEEVRPTTLRQNSSRPQAGPLQAAGPRLDDPDSLSITVTIPLHDGEAQRSRHDMESMERPRLTKKVNTAPGGALRPVDLISPSKLRRPISVILGRSKIGYGGNLRPCDSASETVRAERKGNDETLSPAARPQHRRAKTATLERSNALWERNGDKRSPPQGPLPQPPEQGHGFSMDGARKEPSLSGSFRLKARVQKAFEHKKMGMLKTNFGDIELPVTLSSDNSMSSTPRELYAIHEQSIEFASPDLHSHTRGLVEPFLLGSASSQVRFLEQAPASWHQEKNVEAVDLARPRNVYLPGAIRFEQHPAMPRRDSVATLDPFELPGHRARRISDKIAQDDITMFFEDFDLMDEISEMTLDRYWLGEFHNSEEAASKTRSLSSVKELMPTSPEVTFSPHGSKFSFSSTSSTGSEAPKRPRTRLARLLSPALQGSAFFTPALLGKQAKKRQTRQED